MTRGPHLLAALLLGGVVLSFPPARAQAPAGQAAPAGQTAPAGQAAAAGQATTGVRVSEVWSRATAAGGKNGAVYFTLHGEGAADALVGANAPVAEKTELHETVAENGVMRMRPVPSVKVPPGQTVRFAPGGLHVMLLGLHAPLQEGARFPLTLTFEKGGRVTVEAVVQKAGAATPGHGTMGGHGMTGGTDGH